MAASLKCHSCNKVGSPAEFRAYGLHCSKACAEAYAAKETQIVERVKEMGFTQHPEVPNLFVKNGTAISKEQVYRGNLEDIVRQHADVVASRG